MGCLEANPGSGLGGLSAPPEKKERRGKRKSNVKMKKLFSQVRYIPFRTPPCGPRFPGQRTRTLTGLTTVYITLELGCWHDQYQLESRRASAQSLALINLCGCCTEHDGKLVSVTCKSLQARLQLSGEDYND